MAEPKVSLENLLTISDDELSEDARLMRHYFMQIISVMPNNVYWRSKEKESLGCNNNVLKMLKLKNVKEYVGLNYEEMSDIAGWNAGQGMSFKKDDQEVVSTGQAKRNVEEPTVYDEAGAPVYYLSTRIPLHDEQGEVQGIVGISTDITEIKKREQQLAIYEQIIKNIPCHVYWKDLNGIYLGGSQAQIDTFSNNFIGKTLHEIHEIESADIILKHDQEVMDTGKALEFEEELLTQEGRRYYLSHKSPLTGSNGKIIGMLGVSFDITERKKYEQELAIYEQIIRALPGYIYWKNKDSVYIGGNQNLAEIIGWKTATENKGVPEHQTPWALKSPGLADFNIKADKYVMETGKTIITEENLGIPNTQGQEIIVRTEKSPLRNKQGEIIGVLGNSVDITERKKHEQELAVYAKIMNNLPGFVYWKNKDFKYMYCNDLVTNIANINSSKDIIGKTDYELGWDSKLVDGYRKIDEEIIKTGKSKLAFEETLIDKNGNTLYLEVNKVPQFNEAGEVIGIIGVSIDITKRKKYEQELAIYAQIVKNLPVHVWWKDKKYIYHGCNERVLKVLGLSSSDEFVGKTDHELWDNKIADELKKADEYVLKSGKEINLEESIIDKNKEIRIMLTIKAPVFSLNNEIIGIVGISTDITERKRLEEKQKEFAKTALQVVHDIRSPLTVIDMLTSEISQLPEEQRVSLKHAVRRINDIANNLIDNYKGRPEEQSITQKIPVAVLIDRIISEKRFQFAKKHIDFEVHIETPAYFAFTLFEYSELQRILSNLINNAVEASSEHSAIEITFTASKDNLTLSIKDHGKGMPQEIIDKIGTYGLSHDKEKGAGLGLAHAVEMLNKHRGKLKVTSKINEGTEITIILARCEAPTWFAQDLSLSNENIILIVDDDPSIHYLWNKKLENIKTQLKELQVFHFHNVKEVVQWFNKNKISTERLILLSDNELIGSDMNGQELIKKYRNQVAKAFLVTSHYSFHDLAENLTQARAQLLPKELVMHLPMHITETKNKNTNQQIDFVFLDDNVALTQAYSFLAKSKNKNILLFNHPDELMAELENIPAETLIYIDSQLGDIKGEDFAKTLHERGYQELYLATGAIDPAFDIKAYPWLKGVKGKPQL